MNFNISFSSFQETGQTGTKHLLDLVQPPDGNALNQQDDQVTLLPLQFDHTVFGALPEHFGLGFFFYLKSMNMSGNSIFSDCFSVDKDTLLKIKRRVLPSID